ncbi:13335_t:CDS:2 [Acaulospora morrowiae]|uniref:ATP-dependent DNA helicase n=1 Tax=Acaulospora morrowiae TaxID=94023 RepID=A0A9N8W786_9GLOM|nr:13335_t:CDS:2 [Acaulospora morrowiae]
MIRLAKDIATHVPSSLRKKRAYQLIRREVVHEPPADSPTFILNEEQEHIYDLIVNEGKSVFYTGAAGTGKSKLLGRIIEGLQYKYGNAPVAVTAPTGIAALNIGGTTVHRFSQFPVNAQYKSIEEIISAIKFSKRLSTRWNRIRALVIDEISMLDARLFERLDAVAKYFKKNQDPFGGIQIVVTGDFCQLPPVSTEDKARFCFESPIWSDCIRHNYQLTKIYRQKNEDFQNILNELRIGQVSENSLEIMNQLSRTPAYPEDGVKPSELYPIISKVNRINRIELDRLPHKKYIFHAEDFEPENIGKLDELERSNLAPKKLELKLNAQVMLITNLSDDLVNGSKGYVCGYHSIKDQMNYKEELDQMDVDTKYILPIVRFDNGLIRPIPYLSWTINSTDDKTGESVELAKRVQLPLILAWAISIHKSQGQSLERVKVDLDRIFERGQAYVALSRARTMDYLQVLNFSRDKVMADEKVLNFYRTLETAKTTNIKGTTAC